MTEQPVQPFPFPRLSSHRLNALNGDRCRNFDFLRVQAISLELKRSMAFRQCFGWKSKPVPTVPTDAADRGSCFDCNICFDFARDPVVTLCGHLYCWPCIYKWFHIQSSSLSSSEHPHCPVCKAEISRATVVPLYGRGQPPSQLSKSPSRGIIIPPRPRACGTQALLNTGSQPDQRLSYPNPYHLHQEEAVSSSRLVPNVPYPAVEMVYARVFGNAENLFGYPNPNYPMANTSPRLRRRAIQSEKSLNRISVFLLCCFLLCLLLF
ncbi:hypothetical protein Nepgr_021362 [Nepenthes gracilis]|uniref:E3 ubiquitin-protein ligase RMA n=1 Tax=Nepenthes gracilis TaxID=150966 RepID=A0AAD3T0N7_NEPGR|nr:hypothetical protein Nepgr_021362 [Nepenthes gracilis]